MKQRGFTLIEVMIAMAIFAVSAMAILSATGESINALGAIEKKTLASMVADNQLALLKLSGTPNGERSGDTLMGGQTWYWTVKPQPTTTGMLKAIDFIVWDSEQKRSPLVSVRTYVVGQQ